MIQTTLVFYFIFGGLTVLGGIIGFIKAKSNASLIAGCVSGALLDLSGCLLLLIPQQPLVGLALGTLVTLALLGKFAPTFFQTKKFMPAGMMFFLGAVSLVLSILSIIPNTVAR